MFLCDFPQWDIHDKKKPTGSMQGMSRAWAAHEESMVKAWLGHGQAKGRGMGRCMGMKGGQGI